MATTVLLKNIGKKFNKEWIFRGIDLEIKAKQKLVILGGNGSGKSTLLQVISGFVSPNEGELIYRSNHSVISPEKIKDHISFASPYIQLLEDLSLVEMIEHVQQVKPFRKEIGVEECMALLELEHAKTKLVKQFSSGMKQRLKLGIAILADTPILLLDEPVSNLDKQAIDWYKKLITLHTRDRTVIVCSNAIADEYFFCDKELDVMAYKPQSSIAKPTASS